MSKKQNINSWLRELNTDFNEFDLRHLIYHPRHGQLCRTFIDFLLKSTILKSKADTLFVDEQYANLESILTEKKDILEQTCNSVKDLTREGRIKEANLNYLKSSSKYISDLDTMQTNLMKYTSSLLDREDIFDNIIDTDGQVHLEWPISKLELVYTRDSLDKVDYHDLIENNYIKLDSESLRKLILEAGCRRKQIVELLETIEGNFDNNIELPQDGTLSVCSDILDSVYKKPEVIVESQERIDETFEQKLIETNLKLQTEAKILEDEIKSLQVKFESQKREHNMNNIEILMSLDKEVDSFVELVNIRSA